MGFVILVPLLSLVVPVSAIPPVIADGVTGPAACATYSIEGSLDVPGESPEISGASLEISATAYLHDGGDPLSGHRVIAVFDMIDGAPPIDPVEAVTDADGRVSILLPVGAIGVSFRAESAAVGDCPDVAPGDVPVVVVDVPVLPPGFGESPTVPVDSGMSENSPNTPMLDAATTEGLPVTGLRHDLVLVAGLMLVAGLGARAVRGRRPTEEPRGVSR